VRTDTPSTDPALTVDPIARLLSAVETALAARDLSEGLRGPDAARYVGVATSTWAEMTTKAQNPAPAELRDRLPIWSRTELRAWLLAGGPPRARWAHERARWLRVVSARGEAA